ncbi:MAG: hypothetical protein ACYTG1_13875 [Planctomycetota bacterium]
MTGRRATRWMPALLVALITAATGDVARAAEPVLVRVTRRPDGAAWVGQRVSVFVELLSRVELDGTPRFDLPEIDTALLRRFPGSPLLGSERIDGAEYVSRRYEILVYPRTPGPLTVPAIGVRVSAVEDGASRPVALATDPLAVDVRLPPGAEVGRTLITSPEMTVTQTWSPDADELRVGDAIERTITVRARDVIGVALPPAPSTEREGLRLYRAAPVVDETVNRGALTGERTDVLTSMCERPGTVELPALVYTWWDPERERLEQTVLEGRRVTVRPSADEPAGETPGELAPGPRGRRPPALLAVAAVAVAVLVAAGLLVARRGRRPRAPALPPLNPTRA